MASRPTRIGAVLGSLAVATVLTTTAPASAEDTGSGPDDTSRAEALQRDLGLSPSQAQLPPGDPSWCCTIVMTSSSSALTTIV